MSPEIFSALTILAAAVTAAATIALWHVTRVLARETRKMAAASAQPQVVASIESNDWSFIHADLVVANTGNSTAYDIKINFEPRLTVDLENSQESTGPPFEHISLLKPGQELRSWIGRMYSMLDIVYTVTIEWRRSPAGDPEGYSYVLNMNVFKGVHRLGSGDPLIQIANSAKSIKEDIHRVIGSGRVRVNSYSTRDREVEESTWRDRLDPEAPTVPLWKRLFSKIFIRAETGD